MKQIAEQGFEGRDMELKKQNIKQPDISLILARFGRGRQTSDLDALHSLHEILPPLPASWPVLCRRGCQCKA